MGGEAYENALYTFMNCHKKPIIVHNKYILAKTLKCVFDIFSVFVEFLYKYLFCSVEISP